MKELVVYGWTGRRAEIGQTREIMAAHSKAEVARAAGYNSPARMFNLSRTYNAIEIEVATAAVGQVFHHPLYEYPATWRGQSSQPPTPLPAEVAGP
jgi:hypothetical protein